MLKGYRYALLAVVGWLVTSPALAVPPPQGKPDQPNQINRNKAEPSSGQAKRNYFFSIPLGVCASFPEPIDSFSKPDNPTDNNYYKPKDLQAQQATACFTEWIFYSTILQFFLACLGAWLLFRTIRLSKKANAITLSAIQQEHDNAQRELRAYVLVDGASFEDIKARGYTVRVVIKNFGQTPAYKLRVSADATECFPPDNWVAPDFTDEDSCGPLGAGAETHHIATRDSLPPDSIADLQKPDDLFIEYKNVFIWGKAVYFDCFGVERTTTFRLMHRGQMVKGSERFRACDAGNEST